MKTLNPLKFLLISLCLIGNVYAARLTDEDRADIRGELEELITETKDAKGNVEIDKFNLIAFQFLEHFYSERKLTREELLKFKEELDSVRAKFAEKDREAEIRKLFEKNLLAVSTNVKSLIKEGEICNHWDCEAGLRCAPVPARANKVSPLKGGGQNCGADSECESNECVASEDKVKRCEAVFRCYRPQADGVSCLVNPVCAKGSCDEIYFSDANIGACAQNSASCSSNLDCCSDSCEKGKCVENYKCQDCIKAGKLNRGQKCCADQAIEENGACVPISVPLNPFVQLIEQAIDLVFPQAHADDALPLRDAAEDGVSGGSGGSGGSTYTPPSANSLYRSRAKQVGAGAGNGQGLTSDQVTGDGMGDMQRLIIATAEPSNFETCEINLINDYAKRLSESRMPGNEGVTMMEVEMALLGFEYVAGNERQIEDYWVGGAENKSIHHRVKYIAKKRARLRTSFYGDLRWFEPKIKCLCLEKTGWKEMTDTQKEYYEKDCRLGLAIPPLTPGANQAQMEQYRAERDQKVLEMAESQESWDAKIAELKRASENNEINEGDDALGLKALALLEAWAQANATIEDINFTIASIAMDDMFAVNDWIKSDAGWNKPDRTTHRSQSLYNYEVANHATAADPMTAAALLVAGVIALLGGFAFASTVSTWVTVGVITSAAASAGAGLWMVSSLRGAWYSAAPYIQDISDGHYKCGKDTQCFKFKRYILQPYNTVCNKNISSNACIKHFLVADQGNGSQAVLVDPWIPQGFAKNDLIKDSREVATLLDQGWNRALSSMRTEYPVAATQLFSFGSTSSRLRFSRSIFDATVINNKVLGKYAPDIGKSGKHADYMITPQLKQRIIEGASAFLMEQGWAASETDGLRFGNYVYDYHFVWPKMIYGSVMAYPQPGLVAYIGLIANGLASSTEYSDTVAGGFRQLAQSYTTEIGRRERDFNADGSRININGRDETGLLAGAGGSAGTDTSTGQGFSQGGTISGFSSANLANPNSLLSGTSLGSSSFSSTSTGSDVKPAIAKIREFRKLQRKEAEDFKKKVGNTERGRRLLEKAGEFSNNFYSDSLKGSSLGSSGSGSATNLLSSNPNLNPSNNNQDGKSKAFFGSDKAGGAAGSGAGAGNGQFNQGGAGFGLGNGDYSGSDSDQAGNNGGSNMSPEDARRLSDAIKNRDGDSSKYERQDGMSLWEIVTNTYIRVYDRLLERKNSSLD